MGSFCLLTFVCLAHGYRKSSPKSCFSFGKVCHGLNAKKLPIYYGFVHTGSTILDGGISLGRWGGAAGRYRGWVLKGVMSLATQSLPLPPIPHDLSNFALPHVSTVTLLLIIMHRPLAASQVTMELWASVMSSSPMLFSEAIVHRGGKLADTRYTPRSGAAGQSV